MLRMDSERTSDNKTTFASNSMQAIRIWDELAISVSKEWAGKAGDVESTQLNHV